MTLQPIKVLGHSLGGATLWQNKAYITPNRARSKGFNDYLSKRDEKAERKRGKTKLVKEGRDDDSYLSDAFE